MRITYLQPCLFMFLWPIWLWGLARLCVVAEGLSAPGTTVPPETLRRDLSFRGISQCRGEKCRRTGRYWEAHGWCVSWCFMIIYMVWYIWYIIYTPFSTIYIYMFHDVSRRALVPLLLHFFTPAISNSVFRLRKIHVVPGLNYLQLGQPFCCREPLIHVVKKSPATCWLNLIKLMFISILNSII